MSEDSASSDSFCQHLRLFFIRQGFKYLYHLGHSPLSGVGLAVYFIY